MSNKLIARVDLFLEDSGEVSVKLDMDHTNEVNIEVFKKVIKNFAEDSQKLKVEHFNHVKQTKEQIRLNTVERVNELLKNVEDEKILNKMVSSFDDLDDEDKLCKKRGVLINE